MGRKTDKEAACYTNHHLTSQRRAIPEQVNGLTPEPPPDCFEIIKLPVSWGVYEQSEEHYIPVCTWCDDNRSYIARDGTVKPGNYLTLTPVGLELAQQLLTLHLESKHRKPKVVSPYEPYGFILEQQPEPVRRE